MPRAVLCSLYFELQLIYQKLGPYGNNITRDIYVFNMPGAVLCSSALLILLIFYHSLEKSTVSLRSSQIKVRWRVFQSPPVSLGSLHSKNDVFPKKKANFLLWKKKIAHGTCTVSNNSIKKMNQNQPIISRVIKNQTNKQTNTHAYIYYCFIMG